MGVRKWEKPDLQEEEVGRWQHPTRPWDRKAGRAGLQGEVKDAVCSWHRAEMSPRGRLGSANLSQNRILPWLLTEA